MSLPKISIIIPSFNQGKYLEETLLSVFNQKYQDLEIIVIDGDSQDNSVDIIKKYACDLAYWVSERDHGQTHAINKGLAKCTGDVWSYLNSDDLLLPGSLSRIAHVFQSEDVNWVGASSEVFDETGNRGYIIPQKPTFMREYLTPWNRSTKHVFPCSNVSFMSRKILEKCGHFDESYSYGMDIEYYLRTIFKAGFKSYLIPDILGKWRWHRESKTLKQGIAYGFREDEVRMALNYLSYLSLSEQNMIAQEIQQQQRWLVTRRAMFYRQHKQRKMAWSELISNLQHYPSLLYFRPWYGAIKLMLRDILLR